MIYMIVLSEIFCYYLKNYEYIDCFDKFIYKLADKFR